jgi:hypothetical protein
MNNTNETRDRIWNITLILCFGATLLHMGIRFRPSGAEEGPWVAAEAGSRIEVELSSPGKDPTPLSTLLTPGRCTLVMVGSTTCGASVSAAQRWRFHASAEELSARLPGWDFIWIVDGDSIPEEPFPSTGTPRFFRWEPPYMGQKAGIRAYPAHLVLDGEGRVVQGDVGIPLPQLDDFSPDCTMVNRDATSVQAEVSSNHTIGRPSFSGRIEDDSEDPVDDPQSDHPGVL